MSISNRSHKLNIEYPLDSSRREKFLSEGLELSEIKSARGDQQPREEFSSLNDILLIKDVEISEELLASSLGKSFDVAQDIQSALGAFNKRLKLIKQGKVR